MAHAKHTSSAQNEYTLTYTICDGEHQYLDEMTITLSNAPGTDRERVEAFFDEWVLLSSDEEEEQATERERCVKEYEEVGAFTLPADYRMIKNITVSEREDEGELVQELLSALKAAKSLCGTIPYNRLPKTQQSAFKHTYQLLNDGIAKAERQE